MESDLDDPTARALALLSSLSARSHWSGAELAGRLGVTTRTVRRDIDRLRRLGYDVEATPGAGGGYRLRSGPAAAPLFLDADESVAIVSALMTSGGDRAMGLEAASTRALAKLHHVLPAATRGPVAAVRSAAFSARVARSPGAEPRHLAVLAEACRDRVAVRFEYRARATGTTIRRVEPDALVSVGATWYLAGFDLDRDDWRTFRVDRLVGDPVHTGHGIGCREIPGGDPVAYVLEHIGAARYEHSATVDLPLSRADLMAAMPRLSAGRIVAAGPTSCVVHLGAPTVGEVARHVVDVAAAAEPTAIRASPSVRDHLRALATVLVATT